MFLSNIKESNVLYLTYGKDVDSSMITRHTEKRAVTVEVDAVDVGGLGAPPQLRQDVPAQGVEHADQGALGAGSGHLGS